MVLMGVRLLVSLRQQNNETQTPVERLPIVTGIVLTAANPYFLVWWATVGLTLATKALAFGAAAVVLFALVHWLCDLVWLEFLSLAGFKNSQLLGYRAQLAVSAFCGVVFLGFGIKFLYDAGVGVRAALALVATRSLT